MIELAETDTPPTYVPPASPPATYEDALQLLEVFDLQIPYRYRNSFSGGITWRDDLKAIIAEGKALFDATDAATLLDAAQWFLERATLTRCREVRPVFPRGSKPRR